MKISTIVGVSIKKIKGLLEDGTILYVTYNPNVTKNRLQFSVNRKPVKHTGKTNTVYTKHFNNFAILCKMVTEKEQHV